MTTNTNIINIHVDGSYNKSKQQYGYGYLVEINGEVIRTKYGCGSNSRYIKSGHVPGETTAVLQGLSWINQQSDYDNFHVVIHYDYEGIEAWPTGLWTAKKAVSMDYIALFFKLEGKRTITFNKVKSHSGNKLNNQVDRLAKMGANK